MCVRLTANFVAARSSLVVYLRASSQSPWTPNFSAPQPRAVRPVSAYSSQLLGNKLVSHPLARPRVFNLVTTTNCRNRTHTTGFPYSFIFVSLSELSCCMASARLALGRLRSTGFVWGRFGDTTSSHRVLRLRSTRPQIKPESSEARITDR